VDEPRFRVTSCRHPGAIAAEAGGQKTGRVSPESIALERHASGDPLISFRVFAVLSCALLAWHCGAPSPEPAAPAARLRQLTAAVRAEPLTFNPLARHDATTHTIALLSHAGLVRINQANQTLEPWLADTIVPSSDGLRYRLRLRDGLRFSDGTPIAMDDVRFSLDAAYSEGSAIASALMVGGKRLEAHAVDARTLVIVFPAPFGPGLRILDNVPVLPKARLQAALSDGTFARAWGVSTPPAGIAGAGPFVLAEYVPGQRMVFVRNPHYFRRDASGAPLPALDRLVVPIVPDQETAVLQLLAGQIDTTASEVRPEDYAPLERAAHAGQLQLLDLGPAMDPDAFWINLAPDAFAGDPRAAWLQRDELRQAISLAVDRQAFADTVFLGAATPVWGPVTSANKRWYVPDLWPAEGAPRGELAGIAAKADPARARQLLARIGLTDPDGDGRLTDGAGRRARFTLLTAKGQTALERGAAVIRDDLAAVGLAADVVALDPNALVQTFLSRQGYDAVYFHLTSTDPDPAGQLDFWMSGGDAHVWNPGQKAPATAWEKQIDTLMTAQAAAIDLPARQRLFADVQRIFAAHLPMIHFAAPRVLVGVSSKITSMTPAVSRPQLLWAADTLSVVP
jgi:peptide/nickel transport system substrate-binding protein